MCIETTSEDEYGLDFPGLFVHVLGIDYSRTIIQNGIFSWLGHINTIKIDFGMKLFYQTLEDFLWVILLWICIWFKCPCCLACMADNISPGGMP